jgi:hypothetical protein
MDPYISLVIAARNDNYGGNFLARMQLFLNVLFTFWQKHQLNAELIIVEWNPPGDKPRLHEAINWAKCPSTGAVRLITVPKQIHDSLPNSNRMPMFEYFAKNAGVRRAKGEFVLILNPDLLLSDGLIACFAARKLSRNRFYRIDRYNYCGTLPVWIPAQMAIAYAKCRTISVCRTRVSKTMRLLGMLGGKWPSVYSGWWRNRKPDEEPVVAFADNSDGSPSEGYRSPSGIYIFDSGDFLLASRDAWSQIRGYPENPETYTHLDSYGCGQLDAIKLEQALFLPPCMIFHALHSYEESGDRKSITFQKLFEDLKKLRDGRLDPVFNAPDWGQAGHDLEEITIKPKSKS